MNKVRAGIIGAAGYTGGELLRLLLLHPNVEIAFAQSTSNSGKYISDVHTDLLGETDLNFSAEHHNEVDVLFLCGGHDAARKLLTEVKIPDYIVIIDLSQDFRHKDNREIGNRNFVYGLPELNRDLIKTSKNIANPGCFATAIQLALLPLAANNLLQDEIHVNATTGSTGAGQSLSETSHFSWRNNNLTAYKVFEHQHLKEITETLTQLQNDFTSPINFIPQRGDFTRGIFATAYTKCDLSLMEVKDVFKKYCSSHPFVVISDKAIDLKMVVNTNRCFIHLDKHGDKLVITSIIDNLLKGASGQAVQNMNLIFGFNEKAGLQLKPSAF